MQTANIASEIIDTSKLRTGKEKIYLTIFIIISSLVWLWFVFSLFRQLVVAFDSSAVETKCYSRDVLNDKVTAIDKKLLVIGENCLVWKDLSKEEKEKINSEQENIGEKFINGLTTPVLFFLFFLLSLFLHYISIAYIRMNAILISENQYPLLWKSFNNLGKRLGIEKQPDVFIMLGQGALNAFATKLVFRKFIIIYAELADALIEEKDQSQLDAVVAHEAGHHLLGHTNLFLELFLLPVEYVPFLSLPLSRAREYSADRVMGVITDDKKISERALIKLAVGKKFGNQANIDVFLQQGFDEQGFFSWLAEKISTHPHLPNRITEIRKQ